MGYIDKNLLPDERILFRTKKHLIIFLPTLVLAIVSIFAFKFMHDNEVLQIVEWVPSVIVLLIGTNTALNYLFSDFAVTNKRVMMREGFFFRHANELRVTTISQVNIDQSLIGQILNYGTISLNAFGAYDTYTMIAEPYTFQKSVNEQLDKMTSGR